MKEVVIFDFDGVLWDSETIATEGLLERFPGITREEAVEFLTGNYHEELAKYKEKNSIVEDPVTREAQSLAYSQKKLEAPMFPGAHELLNNLHKAGHTIVLNTSATERNCIPLLEKAGVKDLFDFIACKEISLSKVEKFRIIEKKYQDHKNNFIFITDTLGDLREADIANIPTVCVTWGAHGKEYFTKEPHKNLVAIVDSMDELFGLIQSPQIVI